MKSFFTAAILTLTVATVNAQSNSYQTLQDHFQGRPEVHAFKFSGLIARTILAVAAPEEPLIRRSMDDVRSFRLITIPKVEFERQGLTVRGFTSVLKKDSFEEIAHITDHHDNVRFYHRKEGNNKDRYFVLIDDGSEVVAIELKGHIDTDILIAELKRSKNI
jgi:hypothetical protein